VIEEHKGGVRVVVDIRKKYNAYMRKYRKRNRIRILKQQQEWRDLHRAEYNRKRRLYYQTHREQEIARARKDYHKHKAKRLKGSRIWRKTDAYKEGRKRNRRRMYYENVNYKLLELMRGRIYKALKGLVKSRATRILIGCSIEKLKRHLEKQFKRGMTWNNYGRWHVDHIVPCCSFDLSKHKEQHKCFNYKNLQPLWAKENLSKQGSLR